MIEPRADIPRQGRFGHKRVPVQQQVIVIQQLLLLLGVHIGAKQPVQLIDPLGAPRIGAFQRLGEAALGVHTVGVDAKARILARESFALAGKPQIVAHNIDKIGGVAPIQYREIGMQPKRACVLTQQAIADGMKRPGPQLPGGSSNDLTQRGFRQRLRCDAFRPLQHLLRGTARKSHQRNALGGHFVREQVGHPMSQRVGLARARTCDHQQRTRVAAGPRLDPIGRSATLRQVQGAAELFFCRLFCRSGLRHGVSEARSAYWITVQYPQGRLQDGVTLTPDPKCFRPPCRNA